MRRPITLGVGLALIAGCLALPEPSRLDGLSESNSRQARLRSACKNYLHLCCLLPDVPKPDVDPISQPVSDSRCKCVPYYVCQNGTISIDGHGLIDVRTIGPIGSISTQAGVTGASDEDLDIRCMPPDALKHEDMISPKPAIRKGCGQRNPDGVGLSVTGAKENDARFGEFPWMVAILREKMIGPNTDKLSLYQCGGALIHPRAVITTAYCVNGRQPSELTVRAGEWDTQTRNEIFPHQDREVEYVIVHDKFNYDSLQNDIAILILKTPVDLAVNVDLVCLPAHNETFDAARCIASGWGKDKFGKEGKYQVILKKIDLPVVPRNVCQSLLRETRLEEDFILNPSFICAGGETGKDTCYGDGGSPLVCPIKTDPSRYVQAGIVTWGIRCGEDQIPGVYVNVALFRPWIDEQLVCHNLDITVYQP